MEHFLYQSFKHTSTFWEKKNKKNTSTFFCMLNSFTDDANGWLITSRQRAT